MWHRAWQEVKAHSDIYTTETLTFHLSWLIARFVALYVVAIHDASARSMEVRESGHPKETQ